MTTGIGTLKVTYMVEQTSCYQIRISILNVEHIKISWYELFAKKEKIMGFGHRVYRNVD